MVREQWSVVGGQLSVASCQWSVVSYRLSIKIRAQLKFNRQLTTDH